MSYVERRRVRHTYRTDLLYGGWKQPNNPTLTVTVEPVGPPSKGLWKWTAKDSYGPEWTGTIAQTTQDPMISVVHALGDDSGVMRDITRGTAVRRMIKYANKGDLDVWRIRD